MDLMLDNDGKVVSFADDHVMTQYAQLLQERGCTITPRRLGFKVTGPNGEKYGFVSPKRDTFYVYLTTVKFDAPFLKDVAELAEFEIKLRKGDGGMAVLDALDGLKRTFKVVRAIYAAKPEDEPKPKKAKAEAKPKKEKAPKAEKAEVEAKPKKEKAPKAEKAAADDNGNGVDADSVTHTKKQKKAKAETTEAATE